MKPTCRCWKYDINYDCYIRTDPNDTSYIDFWQDDDEGERNEWKFCPYCSEGGEKQ